MQFTGSTRAATMASTTVLTGGLAVLIHGILRSDIARVLGGGCITTAAAFILGLATVRRWIVDTRDERNSLAAAQRQALAERAQYFAAQAALVNEQSRITQSMTAERAQIAEQLRVERAAMAAEFEEKRAQLVSETMEATFLMLRDGKFAPDTAVRGKLIRFPVQEHQATPAERATGRERTREHGVIGP